MAYRVIDQKRYDFVKSQLGIVERQIKSLENLRNKYWKEAQSLLEEYFEPNDFTPEYISQVDQFIKDHDGRIPKKFMHDRYFDFCPVKGWNVEGGGKYSVYYLDVQLRIKDHDNK